MARATSLASEALASAADLAGKSSTSYEKAVNAVAPKGLSAKALLGGNCILVSQVVDAFLDMTSCCARLPCPIPAVGLKSGGNPIYSKRSDFRSDHLSMYMLRISTTEPQDRFMQEWLRGWLALRIANR